MRKRVAGSKLTHVLDALKFDEFLKQHNPFESQNCGFDLSEFQLITPSAMVQLAAACYALAQTGLKPVISIYNNQSVSTYLRRAGFMTVVEPVVRFQPSFHPIILRAYDNLRGSNPMLIEVTKIETGSALPELLDKVVDVLRNRLKYRKRDAFQVGIAVSEICQNTFDHNSQTCGFLAMQVYGRGSKRFLEIGVADYGDGIAATLRRNPKNSQIASDIDAVLHATRLGTSEHDDQTRGTGLYHLLEITYEHKGSVQVRSGGAKARYRMDKRQGWGFDVAWMPGVQIALTLPSKTGT